MAEREVTEKASTIVLNSKQQVAPLGIIATDGAKELGSKINGYLVKWSANTPYAEDSYLVNTECPRFSSGDGKGLIKTSIRGDDIFIIVDVGNYSCTYKMFGKENYMSPDDHFQDLKRIIQAMGGKAHRISVIMPILYGGRQHRRNYRESLDCAVMLQELQAMGVSNIITFDAHDARVCNAVPLMGFDNVMPSYQVLKAMFREIKDLDVSPDNFMVVSPDEGALNRNMYYASVLGVQMGMFYKRRDYSKVIDGRNPIVAHEFLGASVEGKDVLIIDDMISSGDSMIDVATELKKRKANRIFMIATFGLFTNGLEKFDKAYEDGVIYRLLTTNLTWQDEELLNKPYYINCDMSKYIAYIIDTLNHDVSISDLLDPYDRIYRLLDRYRKENP